MDSNVTTALKRDNQRIPVARPFVGANDVLWGWTLSTSERRAESAVCRGERLDIELLDHVLDARNLKSGVTRRRKKTLQ